MSIRIYASVQFYYAYTGWVKNVFGQLEKDTSIQNVLCTVKISALYCDPQML